MRIALGVVFIVAGATKIGHPADFAASITAYRLGLPAPLVAVVALALPALEILLGAYLVAGLLLSLSSASAAVLLALFTALVASAVVRGLHAPCGCFGPGDREPATWLTVARDGALLVPALYLAWWSRARTKGSGVLPP